MPAPGRITGAAVRASFNELGAVLHYTRAAHALGLWESERIWIGRAFPRRSAPLLEAGCGAGRVALGLWELGYRNLTGFDFARELVSQAASLARERGAAVRFGRADATRLSREKSFAALRTPPAGCGGSRPARYAGALFLFNGLMQIPGRARRRRALREIGALCAPGAPLLFTTHDRHSSRAEEALWRLEAERWRQGRQDPRLVEFGDRYFTDETGTTFMHLPDRAEILADLAAGGWSWQADGLRRETARESAAVRNFSDECRFWMAKKV